MRGILGQIQVNVPFTMLYEKYLEGFVKDGLNPEIGLDASALERFSREDFTKVAKQLHERHLKITLHAPFMDLSPGSPDPAIEAATRHRFEQVLKLLPVFKPKTVVCHAGYEWKRYLYIREAWIAKSIKTWEWLGTRISDEGARLMLENTYEDGPDDIKVLFEELEKLNVGFCLDTGHQAAFGSSPLETWLQSLGHFIEQVHLHDNDGNEDAHLALGQGEIDFSTLFDYLKANKKKPPVITLEPHKEEDLWPSVDYLEKIWPWRECG